MKKSINVYRMDELKKKKTIFHKVKGGERQRGLRKIRASESIW